MGVFLDEGCAQEWSLISHWLMLVPWLTCPHALWPSALYLRDIGTISPSSWQEGLMAFCWGSGAPGCVHRLLPHSRPDGVPNPVQSVGCSLASISDFSLGLLWEGELGQHLGEPLTGQSQPHLLSWQSGNHFLVTRALSPWSKIPLAVEPLRSRADTEASKLWHDQQASWHLWGFSPGVTCAHWVGSYHLG